jgi:di/tricarboxylate transporter
MQVPEMTTDIALLLAVLAVTVLLLVTEALRIDVVALAVMIALPLLGLIPADQAFVGFSSGAVVSIMAVVVLGRGLDRTGVTQRIAMPIVRIGRGGPRRTRGALMTAVGGLSAIMQNVGAAALFLPVALRVAREGHGSRSTLLMPMGFAAILGGTLTMVGSSPLILLNDLVASQGAERFGLLAVTPIGLALLLTGIGLFSLLGDRVLPHARRDRSEDRTVSQEAVVESWHLSENIERVMTPEDSPLVGRTRRDVQLVARYGIHILAMRELGGVRHAPGTDTRFSAGQRLAVLGRREDIQRFADDYGVKVRSRLGRFAEALGVDRAGYAEVLVAPRARIIGESVSQVDLRESYRVEPLALLSAGVTHTSDLSGHILQPGDTLVVHGPWKRIRAMDADRNFVLATPLAAQDIDETKGTLAVLCMVLALAMTLGGISLPLSLLSGALAMVLTRVLSIDEVYRAINWRTVFLLAGLIPLGMATVRTGTAGWMTGNMMVVLSDASPWVILFAVAALTSVMTLFMSNVAATVILVPLVMDLGMRTGIDARALALLVGVCAQNSFLLPTHQVNALLQGPGGYRNADYLVAGGILTLLFLPVAVGGIWLLWL